MRSYPVPFNESVRQATVDTLAWLEPGGETLLDEIVEAVRQHLDVSTALISIVDRDKQRNVAQANFDCCEISRDASICAHAILQPEPLVVPDTIVEPRFRDHPAVTDAPNVRFYAGAPIILSPGLRIGTLCAVDYSPRDHLSPEDVALLKQLSRVVARAIERLAPTGASTQKGEELEEMRSNLVALIGHELRTPLTSILGFNKLLASRLEGKEAAMAEAAVSAAAHLSELVNHVLMFADSHTGEVRLTDETVSLDQLLEETVSVAEPLFTQAGKKLSLSRESLPQSITVDATHMKAAVTCLLINATIHGGNHATLSIRRTSLGDLVLEVEDDGAGFANEGVIIPRPFDVGQPLDTRAARGLGMGLPLTQKLVELHGGELKVVSSKAGTRAAIILPKWRIDKTNQIDETRPPERTASSR